MAKITVHFKQVAVKSRQAGSNDQHMVSRVGFTIDVDGKPVGVAYADLKQVVGSRMAADAIEVGPPVGYNGPPIPQQEFAQEARTHFLEAVGPNGRIYKFSNTSGVFMEDCVAMMPKTVTFESTR